MKQATYRCQTKPTEESEGREAAAAPAAERSRQGTSAEAADLDPLSTKSKAAA